MVELPLDFQLSTSLIQHLLKTGKVYWCVTRGLRPNSFYAINPRLAGLVSASSIPDSVAGEREGRRTDH